MPMHEYMLDIGIYFSIFSRARGISNGNAIGPRNFVLKFLDDHKIVIMMMMNHDQTSQFCIVAFFHLENSHFSLENVCGHTV